jgi:SNF2 family DNA or RNA helicase
VSPNPVHGFTEPKLWEHQKYARLKAQDLISRGDKNIALFFEVGTGKTLTSIMILRDIFHKHNKIEKTLIFCPPIVIENWRRELAKFSKIPKSKIVALTGKGSDRIKLVQEKMHEDCIFITNYEALTSSLGELKDWLYEWRPKVLICDESHKLKDSTAKRTKFAIQLSKQTEYRMLLTGSPMLNSYMDYYSQFLVLDGGKTFGSNFFSFRARYFFDKNAGMPKSKYFPNWIPRPGVEDELHEKIMQVAVTAKKSECLDLPPLVKQQVFVEMSPEQKRAYAQMKDEFVTYLGDSACSADLAITKALRLQQIVSGHLPVEEIETSVKKVAHFVDTPRSKALEELLEELAPEHKVIVWAVFKDNYKTIREVCDRLSLRYVELTGETTEKARVSNVDAFNNEKDVRVLIGHPGSGGIGVNLIASDVSIFYSRSFSLEYDIQAEARNYRGGSEIHSSVTRIDIVCPNTIDELVLESLSQKEKMSANVLRERQGEM